MMRPHHVSDINVDVRRMIAAHLVTNYHYRGRPTVPRMMAYIPVQMEEWKRMKILDRDEIIRTATLLDCAEKSSRDNSFVKVRKFNLLCISSAYQCHAVQRPA